MSIQKVPNADLAYYLASYDKDGRERADDPDGLMSDVIARAIAQEPVTDAFVISHGWKGDVPAAIDQYDRWIGAMAGCAADRQEIRQLRPGFKALLVGFHWPSQPWGDEEFGSGAASFAAPAAAGPGAAATSADAMMRKLVESYADRIADTARAREAIRTILTSAMNAGPGTKSLPPEVAAAYRVLNEEAKLGSDGPAGTPGSDREPFDPDRAFKNAQNAAAGPGAGVASFGGFGFSALLSPLRQLSFWKMKDRARTLGESAGHGLVQKMMKAVPAGREVRFHLMGHSFGCIVVSSMVNGPNGAGALPRPVNSLTLVQGATSLWGYCDKIPKTSKPGYFRKIIEGNKVSGPIVTTQSKLDTAVGKLYPLAAGAAQQVSFAPGELPTYGGLGAFGIQGTGLTLHDLAIGDAAHKYSFQPRHVYNLECSGVIKDGSGPSGAHSDIAKPEVAHAMWEAVKVS
ncbi:MAG TPA: hypothetical protein VKF40_14950 [Burkholderiales bacterium]|nr:hypothetical protein [Burkholderiales bacterium]